MQFRDVILGCAAGVMLAGASAVQAAPANEFEGFTAETVTAIFSERGATDMKTETVEGDPRVTFKVGETTYIVDFFGCEDKVKGCKMLQYAILFEPDASDTVEKVNAFNYEFIFGKAALHKTEGLLSTRAVVGSAGSSKRHLLLEFGAFNAATSALLEHMKAQTVAQVPATGAAAAATLSAPTSADAVRAPARWKSMPKTKR